PYVSAVDVLNRSADPVALQNAIVLIGTTATGLMDWRPTPVQHVFPEVEIHANIISGILDGVVKHDPDRQGKIICIIILLLVTISMAIVLPRTSTYGAVLLVVVVIISMILINRFAWQNLDLVIPLATQIFLTLLLLTWHISYSYFVESRHKQRLSEIFSHHLPKKVIDEMSKSGIHYTGVGDRRNMTVMFTYIRGFSTISEGFQSTELPKLINAFLTPITSIIHKQHGTIDKYLGDSIMAFWGAPIVDSDHAKHSLQAALEIAKKIETLRAEFQIRGWPPLKIGIGINTGLMNVGNMGSEFRNSYTVMGNSVNLAYRFEGFTNQYGVTVIVGEETRVAVPSMKFRQLDRIHVRGRTVPISIYEPVDFSDKLTNDSNAQLESYHNALDLYHQQKCHEAEILFQNLKQRDPERMIYDIYISRIKHYKTNSPGPNWNGVFSRQPFMKYPG
ncbi:MAG: adenylate/guanylate cyclase domain-containing protein, partial [Magnetococcales bacterium]|nr:adenylate/guanylate cyclase domain-containing protein [Magnetococcales bacterium]